MAELYHLLHMLFSALLFLISCLGSLGQFLYPWSSKTGHKKEVLLQVRQENLVISRDGLICATGERPLNRIFIDYPTAMQIAGKEGKVLLACDIEASGKTKNCHITQSSKDDYFDTAALQYVKQARYDPKFGNKASITEYILNYSIQFQNVQ